MMVGRVMSWFRTASLLICVLLGSCTTVLSCRSTAVGSVHGRNGPTPAWRVLDPHSPLEDGVRQERNAHQLIEIPGPGPGSGNHRRGSGFVYANGLETLEAAHDISRPAHHGRKGGRQRREPIMEVVEDLHTDYHLPKDKAEAREMENENVEQVIEKFDDQSADNSKGEVEGVAEFEAVGMQEIEQLAQRKKRLVLKRPTFKFKGISSSMKTFADRIKALASQKKINDPIDQIPAAVSNSKESMGNEQPSEGTTKKAQNLVLEIEKELEEELNHDDTIEEEEKEEEEEEKENMSACRQCEVKLGEEVCGANGKTYNSLCHAVNCAGIQEQDITAGPCLAKDVCKDVSCPAGETCIALNYGPCLTIYSQDGSHLPCRQYTCVAQEKCKLSQHSSVCGNDHSTYPTLCHLNFAKVNLAYTGPCRSQCTGTVCGSDGLSYLSSCHARTHHVRIDYSGRCFAEDLQKNLFDCEDVQKSGRCRKAYCKHTIVPEGSCCPVCGGALTVQPDTAALAALVSNWEEVNHLYMVENFLRHLMVEETHTGSYCELTVALLDSGNISVAVAAVADKYADKCFQASRKLGELVNNPPPKVGNTLLRPLAASAHIVEPDAHGPLEINGGDIESGYGMEWDDWMTDSDDLLETGWSNGGSKPCCLSVVILSTVAAICFLLVH